MTLDEPRITQALLKSKPNKETPVEGAERYDPAGISANGLCFRTSEHGAVLAV